MKTVRNVPNHYLLLLAITIYSQASEKGNPVPDTQLGSDTPYLTNGQRSMLNEKRGMGSEAGIRAVGGLETMMYTENFIQRMAASTSSMYTNMSPSLSSAIDNTVKTGVGLGASYLAYKVGRPLYNHFRPSLEEQVRRSSLNVQLEENKKKAYELEQERFNREKVQQKMHAVNELSKCAYNNSSSSHIDSRGVPLQCSSADFRLVMYHEDGYKYSYDIGRKIKLMRGDINDKQ